MKRRQFPLTPIFDPEKRRGAIDPGGTPPGSVAPTLVFHGFEADTTLDAANSMAQYGSLVVVRGGASGTGGLATMDVTDPNNPAVVDYLGSSALYGGRGVAVDVPNDLAFAPKGGSPGELSKFDLTGGISLVTTLSNTDLNSNQDVAWSGGYAYVVGGGGSAGYLTVVDTTTTPMTIPGRVVDSDLDYAGAVIVDGSYCYVTCYITGALTIVDVSTPASPSVVGTLTHANFVDSYSVAKSGTTVYVPGTNTGGNGCLSLVNVSTPASPSLIGTVADSALAGVEGVDVQGDYAFLAVPGSPDYIHVINCTTPATPTLSSSITNGALSYPTDVHINGSYLYVTDIAADAFFVFGIT